jgi:branched-chain amino acid transport system permease protein
MRYALPICAILAVAPLLLSGFHIRFLTEILIFALFAMSLDIQLGYGRMFSFGHAAPYGLGAYITALALVDGNFSFPVALLVAVLGVFLIAIPLGWLCTRASGVAFSMLTLAFAQLAYAVVYKWSSITGGSDGISGLARNPGPWGFAGIESRNGYYWLTLIIVAGATLVVGSFVRSPMGTAIVAVRENEKRATAIGYEPRKLRLAAFVLSNALAGLAGALHAGLLLFVSPEILYWTLSGNVIVAVVLGGSGTVVGPMIGAALMVVASHQLSAVTESWPLFMGLLFITVVIAAPQGLWGIKGAVVNVIKARKATREVARLGTDHVTS